MRCVITTDDGIDAPGLRALHGALREFSDVVVVAPAEEWSGCGHCAPLRRPIAVERRRHPEYGDVYVVHGQPPDCTRLALTELLAERPDAVVAGINRGANIGVDVYYSGTVAAAREAGILGCPGIAISQLVLADSPVDWPAATARARCVLEPLLREVAGAKPAAIWNVNLPHLPTDAQPKGIARVPIAVTPNAMHYDKQAHGDNRTVYHYAARYPDRVRPPDTDVACVFDGWVTLSQLTLETTCPSLRVERRGWEVS
ncbi:MAG: 5'/3'-nucleotidase SurE [Phycisphaerae bacterium]|nr:5'/3'-nucleotidase SurE [Phycisphaerae bacterium]